MFWMKRLYKLIAPNNACIPVFDAGNDHSASFTSLVGSAAMPCAVTLCDRKSTWGCKKKLFVKLMLMRQSLKQTKNRSSVAKHSSKFLPPKQISSTNDRQQNTGTSVESSGSLVANMLLAGSLTRRRNGSDSLSAR